MNRRVSATALILLCALGFGCVTAGSGRGGGVSDRVVEVDGQKVRVEDLAKRDYDEAVRRKAEGDVASARALLQGILRDYPDASFADHATVALAQILLDEKEPEKAQALLEKLLLENPTSPAADQARYVLALAQLAQGDAEGAAPALKSLVDKLPSPEEKREAALKLAEKLAEQGQGGEAARYVGRALELTEDRDERRALEERLLVLLDAQTSFVDLRRLKETEAKPGTFFDEVLSFKLARVYLHLRDYVSAAEATKDYLAAYPRGRFAKEVRALDVKLRARVKVEPRTIGVILPLFGPYRVHGQRVLTAIKLGMGLPVKQSDYKRKRTGFHDEAEEEDNVAPEGEDVERDLSVEKNGLKLIVRDSKGDPTLAAQLVQELVEKDHVIAIVGDILIDTSLPVALKAEEYGVPVISLSRREGLCELGPWVFRISFTAKKQAKALAELAMDHLGIRRFGILYPRHSYGLELMNAFWDEVEARKGEITAIEAYSHDQTTFTPEVKSLVGRLHLEARGEYVVCKAKARQIESPYHRKKALERCADEPRPIVDFEALLLPDDYRMVSYIVPALVAEDILVTKDKYLIAAHRKTTGYRARRVQLLGGSMWNAPELAKRLGRQGEGAVFVDGFWADDQTDKVQGFVSAFRKVHRSDPGLMEAQAFDAGHLLFAILAGQAGEPPATREAMRSTLSRVKDFPGVTGLLRFDENGDSATPPRFFVLQEGRIEPADLDALREGEG